MSIDEQVHTAPTAQPEQDAPERPKPGNVPVRAVVELVWHSAVMAVTVVGKGIASFGSGSQQWVNDHRPSRHTNASPAAPRTVNDNGTAAPARRRPPLDSLTREPRRLRNAARRAVGVGEPLRRRSAAIRSTAAAAVSAPVRPRRGSGADRGSPALAPAPAGYTVGAPPVERPRLRARPLPAGVPAALPLPANPAAPRPQLFPEDGRPLVVKLGTLLIGAVAGAAAVVLTVGAIVPRAAADVRQSFDLDVILPESADFAGLEQPSRVYASDGTLLAELRAEVDREVVPLSDIPKHMRDAVIAAEDRSFYEHNGYSIEGIGRAALTNFRSQRVTEGGSTLTQQLAKKNFLSDEQTLDRKISELFYAMKLEENFTKDELLERYLNEIYFGVSAYGVQAAAQEYYGIDVQDLRLDQAALIAGVIPAPSAFNPRVNPERALEKRDQVLQDMYEIGAITESERDAAQDRPLDVVEHVEQQVREPYVVAAVKRMFLDDPAFGATRQEREDKLFRGNLDITTTLDPELQDIAEETIEERFSNSDGPTASIATVDPQTGAILAFASGQEFDSEQFDYALQGRQQPGSAFKTFVLATALREGFSPDLVLNGNSPIEVIYDEGRRTYEPQNYGGADYGQIDMARALRSSVNTYFVQLFEIVGREKAVELAGELGIDVPAAIGSASDYGPSLVLGGLRAGVTPVEMAGAYATFANGGVFHPPYLIEQVVDGGDGTELVNRSAEEGRQVFSPELNSVIVDLMRDVTAPGGTGTAADIAGWQTAGKTGTTNDNADAWFTGYTPVLSTAVWVGHADQNVSMPGATGGGTAAPVWAAYMRRAHEGREVQTFPDVDVDYAELFRGEEVQVPDVEGDREADALRSLAERRLIANVVRVNSGVAEGTVVDVRPGPGTTVRWGDDVTVAVSTGVEPAPPPPPEADSGEDADDDDDESSGDDESSNEGGDGNSDNGGDGGNGGDGSGGGGNNGGGNNNNGGGGGNNGGGGNGGGGGGNG